MSRALATPVFDVDLRGVLKAWDQRRARSRQKRPGPSSVGSCRRRFAYIITGQKRDNFSDPAKAIQGTLLHRGVLSALKTAHGGFTEVRLDGLGLQGSCDWLRWDPLSLPIVDDLKTVGTNIYDDKVRKPLSQEHMFQLHLYAAMLRAGLISPREKRLPAEPIEIVDIELITLNRDDGRAHTRRIDYDQNVTDHALSWISEVEERVEVDGVGLVPRDYPGPDSSVICSNCPFLNACWGPQDERGERAPLELADAEMEDWLREYDRGKSIEAEGKRLKELARGHLAGQPPMRAESGWELAWTGGKEKWVAEPDLVAMAELIESAGLEVPMHHVNKARAAAISVKPPKRKAK